MANNQKKKEPGDSSSCLIPVLDDDLVVDLILTRLPVKSLMRFKCVCKAWKSIIEHDSRFIDSHYAHSQSRLRDLLIIPDCRYISSEGLGCESSFFSAELHCADDCDGGRKITGATIHRLGGSRRTKLSHRIYKYSGPVRGLLCLVDNRYAARIYNVSTGQAVTPWIRSAVDKKEKGYDRPKFQLGFDPNTGKHKVVSIWNAPDGTPGVCEVFTVGVDTSWRIIDDVSPCKHRADVGAYVNGSIYWIALTRGDMPPTGFRGFLLAFDVGSEKFRAIGIPSFTYWGFDPLSYYKLLEMDDCLTVQCGRRHGKRSHTVKMWRFHDCNKLQGINGTSSSPSNQQTKEDWSEVTIELPPCVDPDLSFWYPIGKELMILKTHISTLPYGFQDDVKLASFYSYNMINKTFNKFELQGVEEIPTDKSTICAILAESLFSAENKEAATSP